MYTFNYILYEYNFIYFIFIRCYIILINITAQNTYTSVVFIYSYDKFVTIITMHITNLTMNYLKSIIHNRNLYSIHFNTLYL